MIEQQDNLAQEREEIAMRVANFKATQEKFKRERDEYFATTLANARNGAERPPHRSRSDHSSRQ
jgi:uncharacterized protein Yka (UPF0111/DUF47 family)